MEPWMDVEAQNGASEGCSQVAADFHHLEEE
jgi:hypothetical protein